MDSTLDTAEDRDRWMAWGGLVFLLFFAFVFFTSGEELSDTEAGSKVIESLNDKRDLRNIAVFGAPVAIAALLLFTSRLRATLGSAAGAARHLLQYGAVIYSVAILLDSVLTLAMLNAADKDKEGVAEVLNAAWSADWIIFTTGIALLLLGAGLSILRTGVLPRWMGWIAAVLGVVSLLGPGGFAGFLLGPLWIGAASVMLATRRPATTVAT